MNAPDSFTPFDRVKHSTLPDRDALHRTIDSVWRIEAARIIASVARMTRDVGRAEELAQDALVAALEHWPTTGLPVNPAAWLMTTAKRRAIDHLRQQALHTRENESLGHDLEALEAQYAPDVVETLMHVQQDDIGDDLLRLIFTACHPVLPTEARVALTLRLLGGLTTAEIARAFLVPEPTVAQRIVRAKRSLSAAHVPFEVPGPAERAPRLASVLEVIYLVFNEGYAATAGGDWMRPALCDEAEQLARAGNAWGPYALQGAIAACHARAHRAQDTDWHHIVALYDALLQVAPSPVVALNRAVSVGMALGPAAALALVDELAAEPSLRHYHWLPSVRGDLLAKLGRQTEACAEFERAASLTRNAQEKALLLARARA